VLAGGVLAMIGAFLPWVTATVPGDSALSFPGLTLNRDAFQLGNQLGFSADGVVLMVLGVVALVVGVTAVTPIAVPRWWQRIALLPGVLVTLVVFNRYGAIEQLVRTVKKDSGATLVASVGYGFWVAAIGGFLALAGGIILLARRAKPVSPAPMPWPPG
jgi:hypothetical protein